MTLHELLHAYVKALYHLNNRIRNKYSKYSQLTPYDQHRVGMDCEIAARSILQELVSLATITNTKIPILYSRKNRSNVTTTISNINQLIVGNLLKPTYKNPSNYDTHYAQLRYTQLRSYLVSNLPYIQHTQLLGILR